MAINSAAATSIASLYIGFYDRAPDPVGLNYWLGRLADGVSLTDIAESFAASPEAASTYPYIAQPNLFTPEQMINQVYQNVLGRSTGADADGMAYYSARLEAGESVGSVLASIIGNAATNADGAFPDQGVLANKVTVGLNWAETAGLSNNVSIYEADGETLNAAGSASAHGVIDGVDATDASVTEANTETSDFFVGGGAGLPFTLTDASGELVVGTSGADTFTAVVRGANPTLNVGDQIDGGNGIDVLNLYLNAGAPAALPAGASIENVEVINLIATAAGRTMLPGFDASQFDGATAVWQVNDAVNITGLGDGVTAGFRDTAVAAADTVTVADGVSSASIALDGVTSGAVVGVSEATAGDLETVSVSGSVAGAGSVTIDSNVGGVTTLNVSLTSDGTVGLQDFGAVLETFNASGSTGDLTVDFSANAGLEAVTGGSGGDTFTVEMADGGIDLVVNAGAGNDTVNVANAVSPATVDGTVTVTLGTGADVLNVGSLQNVGGSTAATFDSNLVSVTDFNVALNDVLDLSGTAVTAWATQALVNGAIEDATSLFNALDAVADLAATTGTAAAQFVYEGNTYVYIDNGADGLTVTDTLVELQGVTSVLTDANVIF